MTKIPKFKNDKEAAEFWDTHNSTEYLDEMEEVRVKVTSKLKRQVEKWAQLKKPVTLRLETSQVETAKKIARKKSIPYQTLLRMWIAEGIEKEKAS